MDRYLEDRELNSVLEEYFNEVKDDITLNERYVPIEEGVLYWDTVTEAAKFTFLGKVKQNDDLKKIWKECEEAEDILNSKDIEVSNATIHKIGKLALRMLSIMQDIGGFFTLPLCLTIVGIPVHLYGRLWAYAYRLGEDAVGMSYAKKIKAGLEKLKKETNDPKQKESIDKQIKKIDESIKELKDNKRKGIE